MLKKSMISLVVLGLVMVLIILLPVTPAKENISATPSNATAKNTGLNNTTLYGTLKNSSILYTSQIANGTEMRQAINATGHARYTINLGSLARQANPKPGKDLEKVVFICNIV